MSDDVRERGCHHGSRPLGGRLLGALCAVTVSGMLLTGCGGDGGKGNGGTATPSPPPGTTATATGPGATATGRMTEDQRQRQALVPTAKVGYDRAAGAAAAAVPGGKLVALELKRSAEGGPEWETEVATSDGTSRMVVVDGVSGKVTRSQAKTDEDAEDKRKLADRLTKATATWQDAASTATGRKKGTVTSLDLDTDDSKTLVWSVDVVTTNDWNKTTYDIDAANRKVLREHVDRD